MSARILIVGHGRSGTNWLLEILNASPETLCRNEPNEIQTAPLAALPKPWVHCARGADFGVQWDRAADWAATHMGERDPLSGVRKSYLKEAARGLGLQGIFLRPRVRRALRTIWPTLRAGEWPLPHWLGDPAELRAAVGVLKFTQVPGWASWVLENRPELRVLHIVRHPGGFLNSWRNRYLAGTDPNRVLAENQARLREVAAADPAWAARLGSIENMGLEESELWYWRYAGETIHGAGDGRSTYHRIVYEELTAAPLEGAERLYRSCGLAWSEQAAGTIARRTPQSRSIAGAWRERVSRDDVALIERILDDSPMRDWWLKQES